MHQFCGGPCHAYPPPDAFPRAAWRREIRQAYEFFRNSDLQTDFLSQEGVALYYERRAPDEWQLAKPDKPGRDPPVSFRRTDYRGPSASLPPAVSNVNLVHLFDERRLGVLACDMRLGQVLVLQPYAAQPAWRTLYSHGPDQGFNPCHAEVVDLDGDGIKDVLVANLGYFGPTDAPCGGVVWLRGRPDGTFEPHTLLDGVGRVADVQAADFRGAGKLDLVVAAFGWRNTGAVLYRENQTTDWGHPKFVSRVLDPRHGAIHVPVGDLNGDGKPDFAALISQEHFPRRDELRLDSVILPEQTAPGEYVRHSQETSACDHFTCDAGDLYGDGKVHFVTGSFGLSEGGKLGRAITIWEAERRR